MKRVEMYQFQVGYMLNHELKINKTFKEQVGINLEKTFSYTKMTTIRKVLRK